MKRPIFKFKEATHGVTVTLSSRAKLTLLVSPVGWFIQGQTGRRKQMISLTHEAVDILLSALLTYRNLTAHRPILQVPLFPMKVKTETCQESTAENTQAHP
jgi:hypothetical protein